jgi:hypothetical protein
VGVAGDRPLRNGEQGPSHARAWSTRHVRDARRAVRVRDRLRVVGLPTVPYSYAAEAPTVRYGLQYGRNTVLRVHTAGFNDL